MERVLLRTLVSELESDVRAAVGTPETESLIQGNGVQRQLINITNQWFPGMMSERYQRREK